MAKGNMFQGMARGKVGDVIFSRLNGEQVSRVRNRNPRNPRTNKQLIQRAIMATVMQMYSNGKVIFDHSFQGESVGAGCQRAFMSENAKLLRSAVAADFQKYQASVEAEETPDRLEFDARLIAPKTTVPMAFNGMLVSNGTYKQTQFAKKEGDLGWSFKVYQAPTGEGAYTLGKFLADNNIIEGDYFTYVGVYFNPDKQPVYSPVGTTSDDWHDNLFESKLCIVRYTLKKNLDLTQDINGLYTGLVFDVEVVTPDTYVNLGSSGAEFAGLTFIDKDDIRPESWGNRYTGHGFLGMSALIRSRRDKDLRSKSTLEFADSLIGSRGFGLTIDAALNAWNEGTVQIGGSSLVLEGGNSED